jgi:hypothetical protein
MANPIGKAIRRGVAKQKVKAEAIKFAGASKKMTPNGGPGNLEAGKQATTLSYAQQGAAKAGVKAKTVTRITKKAIKMADKSPKKAAKVVKGAGKTYTPAEDAKHRATMDKLRAQQAPVRRKKK